MIITIFNHNEKILSLIIKKGKKNKLIYDKNKNQLHKPGIEPGSIAWQATILPLDHLCF